MRSDFKKLDSFTLDMSKNYLIRNFLRNGRLRVKKIEEMSTIICLLIFVIDQSVFLVIVRVTKSELLFSNQNYSMDN